MGQALYRSYRSKKLSEIVGQEHITTALDHALANGTISHAYLFTGPRGVGKTSIARILAHEINGLPYSENAREHLDIIEIDAASNRRIDEIRDLRDKVHIAPSSAKYKVYIIDEVHMLTKEAFNALLKTLEEPPAHVVFILATTEVHKLPETIISRTQRYAFKPVDLNKVVAHLRHIADTEKIQVSDDALALIAAHGEGSFRDSISLLDQVRNTDSKVELSDVQATLGIAPHELIATVLISLSVHDALAVAQSLRHMHDQGYEAAQVAKQLGGALRHELLNGTAVLAHDIAIKLLGQLVQVPASPDPRVALEIALLDAALAGTQPKQSAVAAAPAPVAAPKPAAAPTPKPKEAAKPAPAKVMTEETTKPSPSIQIDPKKEIMQALPVKAASNSGASSDMLIDDNIWHVILTDIKKDHNTLYSIARLANMHYEPGTITLELSFKFHQKRLNEAHNKQVIADIAKAVTGHDLQIKCIVGEGKAAAPAGSNAALPPMDGERVHNADAKAQPVQAVNPVGTPLDAISNIFGGAEVLES
jgi:DNA polymerase-3 subunit gamma/tau